MINCCLVLYNFSEIKILYVSEFSSLKYLSSILLMLILELILKLQLLHLGGDVQHSAAAGRTHVEFRGGDLHAPNRYTMAATHATVPAQAAYRT